MPENPEREFHPLANLFPLLQGNAFEELVADIRQNGLREPILVDAEGRIVDGRNRYRACRKAGVEPRFIECDEGQLLELVLSLNLRRRHLDESQRAMVAARLARTLRERGRAGSKFATAKSLKPHDEAAALVNVSSRLVIHALKVLTGGCPEMVAAVESRQLSVSSASLLAGLPQQEQSQILARGPKEAARKVREMRLAARPSPPGQDEMVLLSIPRSLLQDVLEALEARGLHFQNAHQRQRG